MTLFSWRLVRLGISERHPRRSDREDGAEGLSLRVLAPVGIALVSAVLLTSACESDSDSLDSGDKVRVVTSLEIFADMVRNVGGDRVDVEALLPSGADPHTFELAPSGVQTIAEADIVFINGLALEETVEDIVRTNAEGPVVELAEGITVIAGPAGHEDENAHAGETPEADEHTDETPNADETAESADGNEDGHGHEEGNPHLWLDPRLASRYVERIGEELATVDAEVSADYEEGVLAYLDQIGILDGDFEEAVDAIPDDNRKLVTFHDAFSYLAERYGLEVVAVVAPSPGQDPSAQDIAELTETIERESVPAVFKEPQFNSQVLEAAADDAGVRVLDLLSDAYAEGVDSYIELMEFNMEQLLDGLESS